MQRSYQINEFNVTRAGQRRQHLKYRLCQIAIVLAAGAWLVMVAK